MSRTNLPVRFLNGDYKIKNQVVDVSVMGPSEELLKDLGVVAGNNLMETFDQIIDKVHGFDVAAPAAVAKLAAFTETAGNIWTAVGVVVDTAFLITDIVDAVRSANTTTFIFVNAVPNSILRISHVNMQDGSWVEVSDATIKQTEARTTSGEATALIYHSQPYRSGGLQQGNVELEITLPGGRMEGIPFKWYNPLGVDTKRQEANYEAGLSRELITGRCVVPYISWKHSTKSGKRRHDVVTIGLYPTPRYFQLPQVQTT